MIKEYRDGKLVQVCVNCGLEREVDVPQGDLKINEFGLYDAVPLPPCDKCGTVEYLNPDLPPMDAEMDIVDVIPDPEWKQRHIVRTLLSAKKLKRPIPRNVPPVDKEMVRRARIERMKINEMKQKQDHPEST